MRKIFKKAVAAIATAAMLIGAVAVMPSEDAKAADTYTVAGAEGLCGSNWSPNDANNLMTDDGDGTWSKEFKNVNAGTYEFLVLKNSDWNSKYNLVGSGGDNASVTVAEDGTTVVIGFDGTKAIIERNEVPTITADDCEEAIDAIGTVVMTKECYNKIKEARGMVTVYGTTNDIANYDDLVAAEDTFAELVTEAAGKIILHVNAAWANVNLYAFASEPATGSIAAITGWPGVAMEADELNDEWFTGEYTISAATNLIFNDGSTQTQNIELVGAGEYWYTVAADGAYTVSTNAPNGWEVPQQETSTTVQQETSTTVQQETSTTTQQETSTTTQQETSTTTKAEATTTTKAEATTTTKAEATTTTKAEATTTTTESATTTEAATTTKAEATTTAKAEVTETVIKVKVDSALEWEKIYFYSWDSNDGDKAVAGAWPGTEMTKDGEYYTIKLAIPAGGKLNMIVNNGSGGDGNQTANIENVDVTTGEVQIKLAADLSTKVEVINPKTGDATPFVAIIATMLALGCAVVVLNTKKANR